MLKWYGFVFENGLIIEVQATSRIQAALHAQRFYGAEFFRTVKPRKFQRDTCEPGGNFCEW